MGAAPPTPAHSSRGVASIAQNLAAVRERIAAAARHAGRDPAAIQLMGVTKMVEPARIAEAYAAGLRLFGENRVQEFASKTPELGGMPDAQFHLIGHLQSNKASRAAELFAAVDSLDSLKLAEKLDAAAARADKHLPVLIEINVGGEASKSGLAAESPELEQLLRSAERFPNLEIRGLMAVPPFTEASEAARPYFRRMRELRDSISARGLPGVGMDTLSLGMSHDFEIAIEEGSTCVRIGTSIFGARPRP